MLPSALPKVLLPRLLMKLPLVLLNPPQEALLPVRDETALLAAVVIEGDEVIDVESKVATVGGAVLGGRGGIVSIHA